MPRNALSPDFGFIQPSRVTPFNPMDSVLRGLQTANAFQNVRANQEDLTLRSEERQRYNAFTQQASAAESLGEFLTALKAYDPVKAWELELEFNQADEFDRKGFLDNAKALQELVQGQSPETVASIYQRLATTDPAFAQDVDFEFLLALSAQPAGEAKPPTIQPFIEGQDTVSKQWNAATGQWEEVSRGPRFQPQAPPVVESPEDKSKRSQELRKEYTAQSKEFIEIGNRYSTVQAAQHTAAGDLALIFSFMKMLDPGSVVREGEFATAQNTAGVPEQVRNWYNKMLTGERLAPSQRDAFREQAKAIFSAANRQQDVMKREFRRLAIQGNLVPEDVAIDLAPQPGEETAAPSSDVREQAGVITDPVTGKRYVILNGVLMEIRQ